MKYLDAQQHVHASKEGAPQHHGFLGLLLFAAVATSLLVLPCFFWMSAYKRLLGKAVSTPVLFVISFGWVLFIYTSIRFATALVRHRFDKKGHRHPVNMFDEVMDALDRIAGGDYNVYVQKQGNYRYAELADKVNVLAHDLNSLEQMRQEFVSNVSHEIQSPLTSITGFASLLKKEELTAERRLHYLEVIEAESKRLSKLSENLLRLSILDSDQPVLSQKAFRLDQQIQDSLLVLEPQWSEKSIEPDVSLERITYTGDEDLLSQVWINLLHNSIKFTPPGGRISVTLQQLDQGIVCTFTDTGSGIPQDSLIRIFERFYKADKARDRSLGGNGLGLSIVKKILDLHEGSIFVASELGKGTSITITLPTGSE